jgi:hypothetical protein
VLYDHPAFAQRQAQIWWNICARLQQSASSSHVRMKPRNHSNEVDSHRKFDLLYEWTPFDLYDQPDAEKNRVEWWTGLLAPEAFAFVVGSPSIADGCRAAGVQIQAITPLNQLPTFHMHQTILPRARLKPGAMLYQIAKR